MELEHCGAEGTDTVEVELIQSRLAVLEEGDDPGCKGGTLFVKVGWGFDVCQ